MAILNWLLVALFVVAAVAFAARLGLLRGRVPGDLGPHDGRLKPPSMRPNSVSSQAGLYHDHPMRDYARIEPFGLHGSGPATIERIRRVVATMAGARVVQVTSGYLHVEFATPTLQLVDDCEFWFDPKAGVIQVRSASRLRRDDGGANRARVEAIRRALDGA